MSKLKIITAVASDKGIKQQNQDACAISIPDSDSVLANKGLVLVIADGVSASSHAQQASQTAVNSFIADYYSTPDSWTIKHAAAKVLYALNRWLYQLGHQIPDDQGSWCTTFTAMVAKNNQLHLLHAGDSRGWLMRNGLLEHLTRDHMHHVGQQHYLGRALGIEPGIEIDYKQHALQVGDLLMLTTDGVHDVLDRSQVRQLLSQPWSLQKMADQLVAMALEQGSTDNLSVMLAYVESLPVCDEQTRLQQLAKLRFPPDLYSGQKIDNFLIIEQLHASKRSQLYLAEDLLADADNENNQVLLKTPSVNYQDDPKYIEGFLREEWIGRRLNHPAVMSVYPPREDRKFLYHSCQYISGDNLRQWIFDHPKPAMSEVRNLLKQIVSAVRVVHRMQILHQDLKPENLMLDQQGRVLLIDFGSARVAGEQNINLDDDLPLPPGTKNYMAPEYFLDSGNIDTSAEQFSIAVMAYEMLSGQLPYKEQAGSSIRVRHYQHLHYQSLLKHRPDLPWWIDMAIEKACSPDPKNRYSALSEFLQDLSMPNPLFKLPKQQPLLERNPLVFWQGVSAFLLLLNLVSWVTD
ncbi:bifunctional protein-serine/threonine kinase/phosphatase [Pelagibaculum spongiae]|uniref:Serine/threonine protein phosphatase n=1 Tax=Pelagibaculum spongiae TaxID=2080658 RepID=A0A2V1GXX6_9GAMM|nr:bifunctional protein-serine/threonine kinase/phosphatase [Pelagibaculum spongiae]PVZ66735.1 serine/threonine protein phosphatase [Pelagibaculum spongiae]